MRAGIATLMTGLFLLTELASAQHFGVGVWGGIQPCPWPVGRAPGSYSKSDDEYRIEKELQAKQRELNSAKDKLKRKQKDLDEANKAMNSSFHSDFAKQVIFHAERRMSAASWAPACGADGTPAPTPAPPTASAGVTGGGSLFIPGSGGGAGSLATAPTSGEKIKQFVKKPLCTMDQPPRDYWLTYLALEDGEVSDSACDIDQLTKKGHNRYTCKRLIKGLAKKAQELEELNEKVSRLIAEVDDLKSQREDERARRKDEIERARTEGVHCDDCEVGRGPVYQGPTAAQTALGVLGAVVPAVLGYKMYKYGVDKAADLGWPVDPTPAVVGLGMGAVAGIGGALSGYGHGGVGCANWPGGPYGGYGPYGPYAHAGGAFGYPQGMMGPTPYGGIFNGGAPFFPWGGGGAGIGFGGGLGFGGPGMLPFPGMGGGFGGPWGPGGGFGGGPGMFPGMGGGFGGGPGMLPYPGMGGGFGGGPGMFPGMGGGFGGPGMFPGMGGGFGGPGGGFGGPGMYPGGMGGMGGMNPQVMQYQLQFMQQYMAQVQAQMQSQQMAMQDYMYRQQTVMSLYQEIQRMTYQIQIIQQGGGYGGGMGPSILPYPGGSSPGYHQGPFISSPGSSGGVPRPGR